jgi:hypothetical protein
VFFAAPAMAATAQQKKETCEFGADDQKLTGAARKKFLSNWWNPLGRRRCGSPTAVVMLIAA